MSQIHKFIGLHPELKPLFHLPKDYNDAFDWLYEYRNNIPCIQMKIGNWSARIIDLSAWRIGSTFEDSLVVQRVFLIAEHYHRDFFGKIDGVVYITYRDEPTEHGLGHILVEIQPDNLIHTSTTSTTSASATWGEGTQTLNHLERISNLNPLPLGRVAVYTRPTIPPGWFAMIELGDAAENQIMRNGLKCDLLTCYGGMSILKDKSRP